MAPPHPRSRLSHRHGRDIWAPGRVRHFRFSGGKEREWIFNRAGTPIQSGICLLPPLARESQLSAAATGALQGGLEIHAEASGGDLRYGQGLRIQRKPTAWRKRCFVDVVQFANYIAQKVLETRDDQQRELIGLQIKIQYLWKHVVPQVENSL